MSDSASQSVRPRALAVERESSAREHLAQLLSQIGFAVAIADNATDAAAALEQNEFALAVVDAGIGEGSGHTLLTTLAQAAVPCIAVIGERDPLPHAWAGGVVRRPVKESALRHQIHMALAVGVVPDTQPAAGISSGSAQTPSEASVALQRQLLEQQTLSALTRSLSGVLDLDVLLTQVVEAAVRLCNAEEGLLLLPDESGKELYIRAVKGLDSEIARNFRVKTGDTLAGQVYRSGKPVLIGDQGLQKVKTAYLVRSLLYVPMSIKGQTIGVLGVNNRQSDRRFSARDSDLLQNLAAHAAVAIENARLYEESVLRARELSMLVQAAQVTNSTLALDQVLSIIASQFIGALDVSQCYITGWSADTRALRPLAIRYRALWRPATGPVFTPDARPELQRMLHQQRPIVVELAAPAEDHLLGVWLPQYYRAQGVLYVPLVAQNQLLGLASFMRLRHPFAEDQAVHPSMSAVHWLAVQTAVMLVGSDASQRQDDLFEAAQQLLAMAGADWCDIALWNSAQQQFEVTLSYGEAIWQGATGPRLDLRQFPELQAILRTPQTLTSGDQNELRHLCGVSYGRSMLAAPLAIKGQIAGLVFLTDTLHERRFGRREIELMQALVAQAANAIDNARLYQDLALSLEELHRAQNRLVQAARLSAMGELAAAVAHQINNPLTTILGDAELMLAEADRSDADRESLAAIVRAGKRAHEVVRRLLTMARHKSGDGELSAMDINTTIEHTLALVRGHLQQGRVTLRVELADHLPPVQAVQGELEDVWMNLLLNARDAVAGSPQPEIGIRSALAADRQHVEVRVWDNGTGISPEHQKHIFDPFYTTKSPGEGTGLGLHISKQIVERCQGSINLETVYNQGTCFIVRLPLFARPEYHDHPTLHPGR